MGVWVPRAKFRDFRTTTRIIYLFLHPSLRGMDGRPPGYTVKEDPISKVSGNV